MDVLKALDEVQEKAGKAKKTLRELEATINPARPGDQPQGPKRKSNGAGPRKKG